MLLFEKFNDRSIRASLSQSNVPQKNVLEIMSLETITNDEEKMNDVIYHDNGNENMKMKKNRMNTDNDAKTIFSSSSENEKEIDVEQMKIDDVIAARKRCRCQKVSLTIQRRLKHKMSKKIFMIIDEQCLAMLKEIIKNGNCEKKDTLNCVCYSHLVLLNNHFDLKTNQLNAIAI